MHHNRFRRPLIVRVAAAAVSLLFGATTASAADLKVGDPAPALAVGKWVKGEPVTGFDKDKVYVVEFWATWCGPCRQTIPHLSELQKKYTDVVFIGQDVWERDRADVKVEPFVQEMGEKMSYRVATDDKSADETGKMAATWMEAAGRNSIPTAFVINKGGTIAWVGHPMQMEPVLEKVIKGTFDVAEAKKQADAEAASEAAMEKVNADFQAKVGPLIQKKDFAGAAKAIDDLATAYPDAAKQLRSVKFGLFLQGGMYDEAYKVADAVAADANDDAQQLNALAWTLVDSKQIKQRDYDRAERYAARAVEVSEGKDAAILDTLARCYFEKGDYAKAVETETKAAAVAVGDMKADLTKTLDEYKAKQAK